MAEHGTGQSPYQGILLVNKEAGPSSNQVLQHVRRALGGVKAGHAGTLDPAAQGLLIVCLGRSTRLAPFLSGLAKEYVGTMRFGEDTDSQDATGTVTFRAPVDHLSGSVIDDAMRDFAGESRQRPPMYSAVKVAGERLYRLARRGQSVPRRERTIMVEEFSRLDWAKPLLTFRVRCSSGTYVRTLCEDLGRRCGSAGHLVALTRTAVGPFSLEQAVTARELDRIAGEDPARLPLIPPVDALPHLPAIAAGAHDAARLRHGQPLAPAGNDTPGHITAGETVKLVDPSGDLVAVARYQGEGIPMVLLRVFPEGARGKVPGGE